MIWKSIRELWTAHEAEMLLAIIGLVLIGSGIFWWKTQNTEEMKVEIVEESPSPETGKITVDVNGAVNKPGVYQLEKESRINEALEIAGGISANADNQWIEKYLNRSAKLVDGQKVFIPRTNEGSAQDSGAININSASQAELEKLPGVGPVTAGKIINGRPYTREEELIEKKIVSQKVWEEIKEQVSVW